MDYERRRWEHGCHPEDPHLVDVTVAVETLARRGDEAPVPRAKYYDHNTMPYRSVLVTIPVWLAEELNHGPDIGHFEASVNLKLLDMGKRTPGSRLDSRHRLDARARVLDLAVRTDVAPEDDE